jgi:hypothetical protein
MATVSDQANAFEDVELVQVRSGAGIEVEDDGWSANTLVGVCKTSCSKLARGDGNDALSSVLAAGTELSVEKLTMVGEAAWEDQPLGRGSVCCHGSKVTGRAGAGSNGANTLFKNDRLVVEAVEGSGIRRRQGTRFRDRFRPKQSKNEQE